MASPLPPPSCLTTDDYHAVDAARNRFLRTQEQPEEQEEQHGSRGEEPEEVASSAIEHDAQLEIGLPPFGVDADDGQTEFRWAVLYENQRGYTLFSLPFFSRRSLLPRDPYPFTVPCASNKRNGNWEWVSKAWMVDMRSDSGQVQYDGFEYNWMFRKKHWTAEVGGFKFVRRRRWIRLMRRAAKTVPKRIDDDNGTIPQSTSMVSNLPDELLEQRADEIWLKGDLDARWGEYCKLMKGAGRDAKKLELWKRWLTVKDVLPDISSLLAVYGDEIRNSFVYPDSRAQFTGMLKEAGLLDSLFCNSGIQSTHSLVDFWSYEQGNK
ncbi:hypothetical protein F5146DRAFT_1131309 [Armillaria mellea]|nr:hypothetical protein F5146DRAFT_1131309 [Armillaria mellea]